MNHPAKAVQHKPHGTVPKPRAIVSEPCQMGRTARWRASQQAEGILMRLVGRLQVDAAESPTGRNAHGYFINGFCAALEALGIVPAPRVAVIRQACDGLLDGALTLQDIKAMRQSGGDTDPIYLRAVSLVRRAGHADEVQLADKLGIGVAATRELIKRMHADGIINDPDMFGTRTVKVQEVRS